MNLQTLLKRATRKFIAADGRRSGRPSRPRSFRPRLESLEDRSLLSLGAPSLLPGDLAVAPAAGTQAAPQIARGDNTSLAVWMDMRTTLNQSVTISTAPFSGPELGSLMDIYAARIDALTGRVIDTTPLIISPAQFHQTAPQVAWNGQEWLVSWATQPDPYHTDVVAARVSAGGTVLDSTPILLQAAPTSLDDYRPWSVSSDGTNFSVVWRGLDTAAGIFTIVGARVAPDGTVLDPGGKVLRHDFFNSGATNADLAFASNQYLLTWMEIDPFTGGWAVRGERLTASLNPIGNLFTVDRVSGTKPQAPQVVSNGSSFFVTWFEDRFFGFAQVLGTRVSSTGQVLDPNGIAVSGYSGYSQFTPAPAWDGASWFVAYNKQVTFGDEDIYVTRVNSAGKVLDAKGIKVFGTAPANQDQPAITPKLGGGVEVLWTDFKAAGARAEDIYGATVSATGAVGAPTAVTLGAPRQSEPRLAASGTGFLSVFLSESSGVTRILAERLDTAGNPLDIQPLMLASGPATLGNPSVAWNGSEYLVVWHDASQNQRRGEIFGLRVTPTGQILDAAPVALMPGLGPDVAALGSTFLIVDTDSPINPEIRTVEGIRVDANGHVLGTPTVLGGGFAGAPHVVPVGNRWLVAWEEHGTHDNPFSVIQANFVATDGTPGAFFFVTTGSRSLDAAPALASSGGSALIAWSAGDILSNSDILGRLITADGTMNLPFGISNAANAQFEAAVAWDGKQFVVDWTDQRNEGFPQQARGDIYGARVDATGTLLDPNGFAIANSPLPEDTPAVAAANGVTVFAYSAFQPQAPFASMRVTLRTMTDGVPQAPADAHLSTAGSAVVGTQLPGNATTTDPSVGANADAFFARTGSGTTVAPDPWGLRQTDMAAYFTSLGTDSADSLDGMDGATIPPQPGKHRKGSALG